MEKLPQELLTHIFSYLTNDPVLPLIPFVNSRWKSAYRDIKVLDLNNLLIKSKKYSLQQVISSFPCASTLYLRGKNLNFESVQDFTGCPTIKVLEFDSNYILPALRHCPKLKSLIIHPSADNKHDGSVPTRNLITILNCLPLLENLRVHQPCIWTRNVEFRSYSSLMKLRLLNMDREYFINDFFDWLGAGPRFSNLEELFLDVEYSTIPENAIKSIALGCLSLKILKFRFATIPIGAVLDICTRLKRLQHLSFGQCKIYYYSTKWIDFFHFVLTSLALLESLHVSGCELWIPENIQPTPTQDLPESLIFPHMKSFKAFDINKETIGDQHLMNLLNLFPNLESFRCDVSGSFALPKRLKLLQTIELRHSKSSKELIMPQEVSSHISNLNSIKWLTLWSPQEFPTALISSSASSLVNVCINYPVSDTLCLPDEACENAFFPSLKTLEIRGISMEAQSMCMKFLKFFMCSQLPNLSKLSLDALRREEEKLENSLLSQMKEKAPHLQYLHLTGFSIPADFFLELKNVWPHLRSLIIRNTNSVDITEDWANTQFYPFLEHHRLLRTVHLSVNDIKLLEYEYLISDAHILLLLGRKKSDHSDFYDRSSKLLQNSIFSLFSNHISHKYWWIKECILLKF